MLIVGAFKKSEFLILEPEFSLSYIFLLPAIILINIPLKSRRGMPADYHSRQI